MSLLEIMVVMAIMAVVLGIGIPSIRAIFDVQQRGAARELALTYKFLAQEASMRNVTFRIAYHLDEGYYQVEVGDPDTLVFSDPESREEYERDRDKDIKKFTMSKKEREEEEAEEEDANKFSNLNLPGFTSKAELPSNTVFAWVYTPQYGEAVTPSEEPPEKPEDYRVVYSYVFASGEAEHTLVRLVARDDPEDGFTVEVEPLTGNTTVESELRDIGESMAWLPEEAPTIR
jgi:type II secretory pathway pseudopilin PulG